GSKLHDYRISLFLCSEVSHFVLESKVHNKQFKLIRNAWHFYHALVLVFKVVCGSIGIALLTP
ncbi:hypothetical protein, partial [Vibrio sp. TRT 17S01]|uniref:hypothetical protein n=1 Tax=Vibrio sp. TRT 17S01 TaxID=3418505 RepID=UPI003CF53FB9